jgi:hypothetical protein
MFNIFLIYNNIQAFIESGELVEYVVDSYESIYETDMFLKFENGVLIIEKIVNNAIKE